MNKETVYKKGEFDIATIFSLHKHKLKYIPDDKWKVINAIISCRTSILGAHVFRCDNCEHLEISYNSCRNRHCPKCQYLTRARWILQRDRELLPVHYFHIVFTIPNIFKQIALRNKKEVYSILFKAASQTMKKVAANPDNLGALTGFFTILHTWDQKLKFHPHIHCVVPGGGFSFDKSTWIKSSNNYFVNVKKLSLVFRGIFLHLLERAYNDGKIKTFSDRDNFKMMLIKSCSTEWVVYSKPPFKGPFWVMRYLARYTNRTAISNERLVCMNNNTVTFSYRDRRKGYSLEYETLPALTFMKRFLNHVLPSRFVRIRYFGFLGNPKRLENITLARKLLNGPDYKKDTKPIPDDWVELMVLLTGYDPTVCPECIIGHMVLVHRDFKGAYKLE